MGLVEERPFCDIETHPYEASEADSTEYLWTERQIPEWWTEVLGRIAFLCNLPDNWDSYGAKAVDRGIAHCAVQILQEIARPGISAPAIVPTNRGNLQFEWHEHGIDLEFEVLSPVKISASFEDEKTGFAWDQDLDYNLTPLSDTLRLLLSRTMGISAYA